MKGKGRGRMKYCRAENAIVVVSYSIIACYGIDRRRPKKRCRVMSTYANLCPPQPCGPLHQTEYASTSSQSQRSQDNYCIIPANISGHQVFRKASLQMGYLVNRNGPRKASHLSQVPTAPPQSAFCVISDEAIEVLALLKLTRPLPH